VPAPGSLGLFFWPSRLDVPAAASAWLAPPGSPKFQEARSCMQVHAAQIAPVLPGTRQHDEFHINMQ
jgi:hypothetical protein